MSLVSAPSQFTKSLSPLNLSVWRTFRETKPHKFFPALHRASGCECIDLGVVEVWLHAFLPEALYMEVSDHLQGHVTLLYHGKVIKVTELFGFIA
jgi:hypothetical protein